MVKNFIVGYNIVMTISRPLTIYFNNTTTMNFSLNNKSSTCTKHFDMKYQFIREKICKHVTCIKNIPTTHMLADLLTKGLIVNIFKDHVTNMGLSKSFDIMCW